jgi:hypothetical protein
LSKCLIDSDLRMLDLSDKTDGTQKITTDLSYKHE